MNKGIMAVLVALCCAVAAKAGTVELISRSMQTTTATANGTSLGGEFSADGKFILFSSTAGDLVNLPSNNQFNLYALNMTNNTVELISAGTNGGLGNGGSYAGGMSRDHRYVVFQSSANNLGAPDTNGTSDIYFHDRVAHRTILVSHNLNFSPTTAAGAGNDSSQFPEVSDDGEWVVFTSYASNLVANDTNQLADVFAWDRSENTVHLVSVGLNGGVVNAETTDASISPSGVFVLFTATGTNLVAPNRSGGGDVYLRNLETTTTRWVSGPVTNLTGFSSNSAANAAISADERYVFMLASPPLPGKPALVRVDLSDDSVLVIATNLPAVAMGASWFGPAISDDGQAAAFSNGTNVFYWTAASGAVTQVDVPVGGAAPDGFSDNPAISHDGKKVAFLSTTSELVAGMGNGEAQVYVRDMTTGETKLVTRSLSGVETSGNEVATVEFSADDSTVLFDSLADGLVALDNNEDYDVFTWNVATTTVSAVSTSRATVPSLTSPGVSNVGQNSLSADGRLVAFNSLAKLTSNDTNGAYDAYVFDRVAKTTTLVSAGPSGFSLGGGTGKPMISANGKKVAFECSASGLAGPEDIHTAINIYVRDLETGSLMNISRTNAGAHTLKFISADGRYVFFTTDRQLHRYDLVANSDFIETTTTIGSSIGVVTASADGGRIAYQENLNVYIHDFSQPSRFLVQSNTSATSALRPMLTADGSELVYFKQGYVIATNLNSGQTNAYGPIPSMVNAAMSADGQIVAYQARLSGTNVMDIWVLDRSTGATNRASHAAGSSSSANADCTAPAVSADGRFIAFESFATDLVVGDANGLKDAFVYDRLTDKVSLASHAEDPGRAGNSASFNPVFGPTGHLVLFISNSSDLIAGDFNESIDVFAVTPDESAGGQDTDGDGLDDAWEQSAFSTLNYGANDDPDGDGMTNLAEFRAGTNPASAASALAIASSVVNASGGLQMTFSGVAGHRYQLQHQVDLGSGNWTAVGSEITAATTGQLSIDLPSPDAGYYRVSLIQ